MNTTIRKDNYSATISTLGAELISLEKDGKNILWNRNQKYWGDSALVLFPFVGRNYSDTYTYNNEEYNIGIHGFGPKSEFSIINQSEDSITLSLHENEETLKSYPFHFNFKITFTLSANGLNVTYSITNDSKDKMYFTCGWHPGFIIDKPLNQYKVSFPKANNPEEICIVTKCMVTDEIKPFYLEDNSIRLDPSLFTESAKILKGVGDTAILYDLDGNKVVEIEYSNFENIVLWQTLNSDAPFICIEGWRGVPGRYEKIDEITETKEKTTLEKGETFIAKAAVRF